MIGNVLTNYDLAHNKVGTEIKVRNIAKTTPYINIKLINIRLENVVFLSL